MIYRKLTVVFLLGFFNVAVLADSQQSSGSWCFYEQSAVGNTVSEKVDINFKKDHTYIWKEGPFEQKGSWEVKNRKLIMSDVGSHKIISIEGKEMVLERGSTMKFKRGNCESGSFSDMDVTMFHNAASTGDIAILKDYIERGIDVNATDLVRGDTALIKASLFCKVEIAGLLLKGGADKKIKNDSEKTAMDFAGSSKFHKGCNELVKLLE